MDWKLELVAVPVSDVDRAKSFYTEKAGFNADHDHRDRVELQHLHGRRADGVDHGPDRHRLLIRTASQGSRCHLKESRRR